MYSGIRGCVHKTFEGRKRVIVMESMLAGKLILVGMKHYPGSTMAADTFGATVS